MSAGQLRYLGTPRVLATVIWWKNSILWVAGCSLYANVIAHLAAYAGARAEDS